MNQASLFFVANAGFIGASPGRCSSLLPKLSSRRPWITCPLIPTSTLSYSVAKRECNMTPFAFHKPSFEPSKDWHKAIVEEKEKVCREGYRITLKVPLSLKHAYTTPGMYVQLRDKDTSKPRLVALSSTPDTKKHFQIFIKASDDFPWVAQVRVGDHIQISTVMGFGFANAFGEVLQLNALLSDTETSGFLRDPTPTNTNSSISKTPEALEVREAGLEKFSGTLKDATDSPAPGPVEDVEVLAVGHGWLAAPLKSVMDSAMQESTEGVDVIAVGSGWLGAPLKGALESVMSEQGYTEGADVVAVGSGWLAAPLKGALESVIPEQEPEDADVVAVGSGWLFAPLKGVLESVTSEQESAEDADVVAVGSGWLAAPLKGTLEFCSAHMNRNRTDHMPLGTGWLEASMKGFSHMLAKVKGDKYLTSKKKSIKLIYEMPSPEVDPWAGQVEKMEQRGVEVIPVMSRPEKDWNGRTGTAQRVLKEIGVRNPKRTVALLSAPKETVDELKAYLIKCGVPERMIFCPFEV
ncbi:Ferredoxin-NADP reductase (FNR) [Gracilaria domingensis]|nr:Ferredoxin-NADP reductase (FNR) [Gracilaria domingensis]